jgi:hypothetical protein
MEDWQKAQECDRYAGHAVSVIKSQIRRNIKEHDYIMADLSVQTAQTLIDEALSHYDAPSLHPLYTRLSTLHDSLQKTPVDPGAIRESLARVMGRR